ncbi:hypothetical protein ACWDG1_27825 [Streptomyces sp. NPDC001177]
MRLVALRDGGSGLVDRRDQILDRAPRVRGAAGMGDGCRKYRHGAGRQVWGDKINPQNFQRKARGIEGFLVKTGERRTAQPGKPGRALPGGLGPVSVFT